MRVFKRAVAFILMNLLVISGLQLLMERPRDYEQILNSYEDGDWDSLIIGTSYGENLIPELLPEGEKILNISRPKVSMVDYLYIVKELHKQRPLRQVYCDIYFEYWTGDYTEGSKQVDMLKFLSGREKLDYFRNVAAKENYNNFFCHYELGMYTIKDIPKTLEAKYRNLVYGEEYDHPKMVVPGKHGDMSPNPMQFSPNLVMDSVVDAFRQLCEFCREEGIGLTFYINPFPPERIRAENMDVVHDYYTGLLAEEGLPLYDMNYLRWGGFPRELQEYYDMDGHMHEPLARRFTGLFTEILNSETPEDYFESDFAAVLQGIPPKSE